MAELQRANLRGYEKVLRQLPEEEQEELVQSFETIARILAKSDLTAEDICRVRPLREGGNNDDRCHRRRYFRSVHRAYALERQAREAGLEMQTVVLEKEERLGGKIWSRREEGFLCEWGPNGFLDSKPMTLELCDRLGHKRPAAALRRQCPQTLHLLRRPTASAAGKRPVLSQIEAHLLAG